MSGKVLIDSCESTHIQCREGAKNDQFCVGFNIIFHVVSHSCIWQHKSWSFNCLLQKQPELLPIINITRRFPSTVSSPGYIDNLHLHLIDENSVGQRKQKSWQWSPGRCLRVSSRIKWGQSGSKEFLFLLPSRSPLLLLVLLAQLNQTESFSSDLFSFFFGRFDTQRKSIRYNLHLPEVPNLDSLKKLCCCFRVANWQASATRTRKRGPVNFITYKSG